MHNKLLYLDIIHLFIIKFKQDYLTYNFQSAMYCTQMCIHYYNKQLDCMTSAALKIIQVLQSLLYRLEIHTSHHENMF